MRILISDSTISRRIFHDILMIMARDRSECATDWAVCSISRTIYVSHRSFNLIIGFYSMSVFLYGIDVLIAHADEIDDKADDVQLVVPARELFLKMELPFESNASPVYEVVMVTQFFSSARGSHDSRRIERFNCLVGE